MIARIAAFLILSFGFASAASAQLGPVIRFTTYDFVLPEKTTAATGLQFSPAGGAFVVFNAVVSGPNYYVFEPPSVNRDFAVTPLYLSFALANGKVDQDGAIQYQPDPNQVRLYVADSKQNVYYHGQFLPGSPITARRLPGSTTGWRLVGLVQQVGTSSLHQIQVFIDTAKPPGKQITTGQLTSLPTH